MDNSDIFEDIEIDFLKDNPKSITAAGHFVFKNCTSLTEIRFEGTADELMAINEFENHEDCGTFENVPATQIICSDKIINI